MPEPEPLPYTSQPRLMIVAESLRGGLGAVALAHSEWFLGKGWAVILVSRSDPDVTPPPNYEPIDFPTTARNLPAVGRAAMQLGNSIRQFRPELIHCHGMRSFLVTTLAGRRAFITLHIGQGAMPGDSPVYLRGKALSYRFLPRAAKRAFTATPEFTSLGWEFAPHASPNLVGLQRFPLTMQMPRFLWLGRLAEQKRPDLFIRALANASRVRSMEGLIAGDGPLEPALRELALELDAPVTFLGHRTDVSRLLRETNALVIFSRFEALTFSAQEAMWAGRPVIASPLPGLSWLLGETGVLSDDPERISEALLAYTDPDVASEAGARAADRVRSILSVELPWPQIEQTYHEVLRSSR